MEKHGFSEGILRIYRNFTLWLTRIGVGVLDPTAKEALESPKDLEILGQWLMRIGVGVLVLSTKETKKVTK